MPLASLLEHFHQQPLGHLAAHQPLAVLGEHRYIPDRIVHRQAHEPAEQKVVVDLLHQLPLALHRVQHLNRSARTSFSGAIEGRPPRAYKASKCDDIAPSASSTIRRIPPKGWSLAIRCSALT
jgi:hypothetical protein